jgi:ABC-2 type transport system permease protein
MRAYFLFELRRLIREPRLALFAVITPVISYAVFSGFGAQSGDGTVDLTMATAMMIGLASYGAVIGVLSVGGSVSNERATGWLRQLRATPLPPSRVVVVRAILASVTAIPPIVAVGLTAFLQHGITLSAGRWVAILVLMWLGTLPFAMLGLAVGYGLAPTVAQPAVFLGFFGLSILGGLLVPVQVFPTAMRELAYALPTYRYAELGWRSSTGLAPDLGGTAILLGWTAAFALAAMYTYRRFASAR